MAKSSEARRASEKVKSRAKPEIDAAMAMAKAKAKAIREVKRAAVASKATLAGAGKNAWSLRK